MVQIRPLRSNQHRPVAAVRASGIAGSGERGCIGDAMPERPVAAELEGAGASSAAAREVVSLSSSGPQGIGTAEAIGGRAGEAAAATGREPTVEELLEEGLGRAGASPVHLAIRGTPAADSVRCAWRGVARSVKQREGAIRFWLQLGPTEAIPTTATLELLFAVVLDTLDPAYRETAKANLLAIAGRGVAGLLVPDLFHRLRRHKFPAGQWHHADDGDGGV